MPPHEDRPATHRPSQDEWRIPLPRDTLHADHSNDPLSRLLRAGPEALSDTELISLLLQNGHTAQPPALELARQALFDMVGQPGLVPLNGTLMHELGAANAASLFAVLELSQRLARARIPSGELLDHAESVAGYLNIRYGRSDQELMGALYLDARNRLISEQEIFRGTLTRAAVEPRAILKEALLSTASSLILFHTHPSGDPTPSDEDMAFTSKMIKAGKLLGVRVLDHLILGGGQWLSMYRRDPW